MTKKFKSITVFCSASGSTASIYCEYMRKVGEMLAENGITMVFGGGDEGMMGKVLQGVLNKNGKKYAVITEQLFPLECHNPSVYTKGELITVDTMAERKAKLIELGDAILVGPGGWGTVDEVSEYAVAVQIGNAARKPMLFLNFNNFWKQMMHMMLNMLQEGTLNNNKVDFIDFVNDIDGIFPTLDKIQERIEARENGTPVVAPFCACVEAPRQND